MKNLTIKRLQAVRTYEDLEALEIGRIECDISHRGGGIGFWGSDVATAFEVSESDLPRKYGAGCNYLGGGIRGSISPSGFNTTNITGKTARLLDELGKACVRVYENVENESGLNSDYEDGETNWDAEATRASRKAGIKSAY
jgi:hypothetical protein